jgi:hypothetical protein
MLEEAMNFTPMTADSQVPIKETASKAKHIWIKKKPRLSERLVEIVRFEGHARPYLNDEPTSTQLAKWKQTFVFLDGGLDRPNDLSVDYFKSQKSNDQVGRD